MSGGGVEPTQRIIINTQRNLKLLTTLMMLEYSKSQVIIHSLNDQQLTSSKIGRWRDDGEVSSCQQCQRTFTLQRRKHHCRYGPFYHGL
jgi:hypothetical protein